MLNETDRMKRLKSLEVGGTECHETVLAQNQVIRKAFDLGEKFWVLMGANVPHSGMHNTALNEILKQAVNSGYGSSYDHSTPYVEMFNEAAASFQKEFFGVDYDPETDIIRTNAAGHAYEFFFWCFSNPGDLFISEDPSHALGYTKRGWETYGAETRTFPLIAEDEWEPDIDQMRKITIDERKNNVITLVHPNNPVGRFHSEKTLRAIVDFAGENDMPIISDEIYALVMLDDLKCNSLAKIADDVPIIVINSFSKFFMNPGWGIGYMAIHDPEWKIKEALRTGTKSARFLRGSTPIIGAAAIGMLNCVREHKENLIQESLTEDGQKMSVLHNSNLLLKRCRENNEYILKRIDEIDGLSVVARPNSTFYMLVKIDGIGTIWKSDSDFLIRLAREENIALQNGLEFGEQSRGYYRSLNFYSKEVYAEVYDRIERFIKRHNK